MKPIRKVLIFAIILVVVSNAWLYFEKSDCESRGGVYVRGVIGFDCVRLQKV